MSDPRLPREAAHLAHVFERWRRAKDLDAGQGNAAQRVISVLLRDGPLPVPKIARRLGVSRQTVQQKVDALLDSGRVRREPNPSHRRSWLVVLTDSGRAVAETRRSEELDALRRLPVGVSDDAARDALRVLHAWSGALLRDIEAADSRLADT